MQATRPVVIKASEHLLPRKKELTGRCVGAELMLRDPATEQVHFFNETACLIWQCCDGETTIDECEARLRARYQIPFEVDVAADVCSIVQTFASLGLLEKPPVP